MCTLPHIRRRDIMDLTVAGEKRGAGLILLLLLLAGPVVAQQQQVPTSRLGQHPDLMFFTQQDDRREDQVSDVAAFVEPSVGIVAAFRDTSTRTNISHGIAHHQEHYHQTEHIVKYQQNPELDASKAAAASPAARRGGESSAVVPSSATQDARLSTASDRPALSDDSARHSPPPSSRSDRRLKAVRGPVHRNEASRRQSEGRGVNVEITCTTSGCPSGSGSPRITDNADETAGMVGRIGTTVDDTQKWMSVVEDDLENMRSLTVLPKEGIIYCPIPKVASAEWKRALRWVEGIDDWVGEHSNIHSIVKNGLHRLVDWGPESTNWALNSDRFFRFVVVREPAERLVSAFLNKCVLDGYMSGRVKRFGAPSCAYITLMPSLFPNATEASLETHERLRGRVRNMEDFATDLVELIEREPENTFYHFARGVRETMMRNGGTCKIQNHHFRPQFCSCQLHEFLPLFYVLPFSNMSAEAAAFADRLPQAHDGPSSSVAMVDHVDPSLSAKMENGSLEEPESGVWLSGRVRPATKTTALEAEMAADGFGSGVDKERREEIRVFFTERFERARDTHEKVTGAAQQKAKFLSKRVLTIVQDIYAEDYDMFGDHFR